MTTQMKDNVALFMIGMHCFVHRINLTMLVLSKVHLETLLQAMYGFFLSPKKILEFQKLFDVLTNKENKLLKNVKTRWINMLSSVKHVMEQY